MPIQERIEITPPKRYFALGKQAKQIFGVSLHIKQLTDDDTRNDRNEFKMSPRTISNNLRNYPNK